MFKRTYFQDMLSSWFEMGDDHINPTLPWELPSDLHLPDDNLFSSVMSDFAGTLQDITSFLLDSQPELDIVSMLLDTPVDAHDHNESSTPVNAVFPLDDVFQCAPVGSCLGNGMDAPPPAITEPTLGGSTLSSSTVTTTSWPVTQPSLDVTINVSSQAMGNGEEDEGEGHTDQIGLATMSTTMNSKNLVSERNRRKRLSQQLLALRALVPNITKMDKRSVLSDALAYLRSIHEEIAGIQEELKRAGSNGVHASLQNAAYGAQHQGDVNSLGRPKGEIVQIETEKMDERRFVFKMTCKGGTGVGGEVLHMIESMGLEITYVALEQIEPQLYATTVFIRARKHEKMTEEKLKDCITSTALRTGLLL